MSDAAGDPTVDPQQVLLAKDETPAPRGWLGKVASADSLVVTLLAFLTAMVVGGVLIASADPRTQSASHYFFQYPWDTFHYGLDAIWSGYKAMFEGAIFNPNLASKGTLAGYLGPALRDPHQRDAADPGRSLGRPGVPGRPVQHRWPGSGDHGRHLRRLRGLPLPPAGRRPPTRGDPGRHARWRAVGRDRGLPQGQVGGPRGDHDDHAQLRRAERAGLPAEEEGLPGAAVRPGDLEHHRQERPAATAARW